MRTNKLETDYSGGTGGFQGNDAKSSALKLVFDARNSSNDRISPVESRSKFWSNANRKFLVDFEDDVVTGLEVEVVALLFVVSWVQLEDCCTVVKFCKGCLIRMSSCLYNVKHTKIMDALLLITYLPRDFRFHFI